MSKRRLPGPAAMSGMVSLWGASSLIRSVQRGTIAITGGASGTFTLASVDVANTRLRFLGCTASLNVVDGTMYFARVVLTNATTITASVNTSPGANTLTVSVEVIEYVPGVIRSVQRGTITPAGGNATATITTVNTARTELGYMGFTDVDTSNNNGVIPYMVLTNATTVTATNVVAVNATIGFEAVEWF